LTPLMDSHCHLQDAKFDEDRAQVLAEALDALDAILVVGDDLATSRAAIDLVQPGVHAVVGIHPYHAAKVDDAMLHALHGLLSTEGVVALGEIGLDYFNEFSPRAAQGPAFEQQLALAARENRPVVIHCRQAEEDTLTLLRKYRDQLPNVVMHCFGGDAGFAEACLALDCHISFAGNVTYPKARELREAALVTPMNRLLVETDAPYLAPQVKRGKRCTPALVQHTAAFLAELKAVDETTFAQKTTENARRIFGLS
jgi:TatD DNase family protein